MLARLSPCGVDRDDHVPKKVGVQAASLPLLHRERENVGRAIHVAKGAVELVDGRIVAEQDAQLRFRHAQRSQHSLRSTAHLGGANGRTSVQTAGADDDRHAGQRGPTDASVKLVLGRCPWGAILGAVFERILIANRGEVAARIARTCRRLGLETIGVHIDGEEDSAHVEACDRSIRIGDVPAAYCDIEAVLAAARSAEAEAIYPGYGLDRDLVALARAAEEASIAYVGPSSERLEILSDRLAVRTAARELGVRTLPGSERPILEPNQALEDVDAIGYSVVVKSVRGFGEPDELPVVHDVAALSDALDALGPLETKGGAYIERWIERARHVEVQLLVSGSDALVLGDREVSLRKGAQRLFAESPAPALDQLHYSDAVRGALWDASTEIALALGCTGLACCQFLLDADGTFYFVGLAPGLTVEHTTTEMCCNLDLVELSLAVAAGDTIPPEAWRAEPTGSACFARVDAALDPRNGRPFESRIDMARWPPAPQGKVRIETGVKVGDPIRPDYDPMIASVTTYAPTRHDALLALDRVLAAIQLAPVVTNVRLLRKALNHESVRAGQYDDELIERI